ncbi:carboxylesterase family protein [Streptomyces sp. SID10853]|uniref:carboxylesterase family protein n=1 Tax=Streptomyces sp. SID10853 TaxID=2706028 RepID=UPI0013C185D4|nr:carboxylesterase family protein [Streptomyces sp. SID10853]NDZ82362.1 carboxylesterase family protein [Streptomyces sp. SID10853]
MIVQTSCGPVEGKALDMHAEFLDIPYADAPYPHHAFGAPPSATAVRLRPLLPLEARTG